MEKEAKGPLAAISTEALVEELSRRRHGDKKTLDEVEEGIEAEGRRDNRRAFEEWLRQLESGESGEPKACPRCGQLAPVNAYRRARTLVTLHGTVQYHRNHHYCRACQHGFHPLDAQVDAPEQGHATRACQRRVMDFAVNETYEQAVERFSMHYGFEVSTCQMQCIVERLPLPEYSRHEEVSPQGRLIVQTDGSMVPMRAGWKEAKLATVVSEAHHVPGTQSQRGHVTQASYVATMGDVHAFEAHLQRVLPERIPLKERSKTPQPEVVWLGDGAAWIWNMQQRLCPTAIAILDWSHAIEHANDCGRIVLDEDEASCRLWVQSFEHHLHHGQVDLVIAELKECQSMVRAPAKREALRKLIAYYTANRKRMNYPEHRAHGRMIGSGIVESGHRHVLQARMKKAGQHWSEQGAEKMARLRAVYRTHGPRNFYDSVLAMAA